MNRNLEWHEGAPEKLEPGMAVFVELGNHCDEKMHMISYVEGGMAYIEHEEWIDASVVKKWTWLVKPHELEWHESMAKTNAKSRPEQ